MVLFGYPNSDRLSQFMWIYCSQKHVQIPYMYAEKSRVCAHKQHGYWCQNEGTQSVSHDTV